MSLRRAVLAVCLVLAGCGPAGLPFGKSSDAAPETGVDPLAPAYVDIEDELPTAPVTPKAQAAATPAEADAPETEAAAEVEPETADAPAQAESPAAPDANAEARSRCLRAKGSFTPTKTGAFICVRRTRDSSKGCSASGQCEGACLARSRSCSPVTPLVGCHDVLTDSGKRATVCVD